ncbi:MAG TPA: deoxyribose-phosphate aldolase [Armatimonadetes bacterium]|nr:deoxyribose-phosphate aldolase [Armatimonadota bacterium]
MLSRKVLAKTIDCALLRPDATREDILKLCEDAKRYHFAAVFVFPYWVRLAARELRDSDVKVCAPVGYPYGITTMATKIIEAKGVIAGGATEIEVMINLGALKSKRYDTVRRDLEEVMQIVHLASLTQDGRDILTKVVLETSYLTEEEKRIAARIAREVGADFIKTCTEFGPGRATLADIRLIRSVVGREIGIKVTGGVDTLQAALRFLDAGANRIGTSAAVEIIESLPSEEDEPEEDRESEKEGVEPGE